MTIFETSPGRTVRPRFAADQHQVPTGRRIDDLLTYAAEIAATNDYTYPIRLSDDDRLVVAMLLSDTADTSELLLRVVGELIEAHDADARFDHNDPDSEPGEKYRQSAAGIVRDAVIADSEASR